MSKDDRELIARTPAQFFFEMGFGAAFARALIANDMKPPFEISDALIERAWEVAREAHDDHEEFDRYLSAATRLEALQAQPVEEREAIARIIDPDCAKVTWAGTDDEQHIVRMRVCRERLKQWGDDGECDHDGRCEECSFDMAKVLETDASKARRAEAFAKADAILALTPAGDQA